MSLGFQTVIPCLSIKRGYVLVYNGVKMKILITMLCRGMGNG